MNIQSTPVFEIPRDVKVSSILVDPLLGATFFGLSDGRILKMDSIYSNAYLTGERSIYAQVANVFGELSEIGWSNVMYRLSNKLVKFNDSGENRTVFNVNAPYAAIQSEDAIGVFTTPVLWGGSDFGYWERLEYNQNISGATRVIIGLKVAKTEDAIASSEWKYFENTGTSISLPLDCFNNFGSYIQIQVILKTANVRENPEVIDLVLNYRTKYAVYLFTRKFIMERNTNLKSGLITGTVVTPPYTEVKFGISATNSTDWNDYKVLEMDKSFVLPEGIDDQFKIGIKMTTFKDGAATTVDGFAVMFGADKDNLLNRIYQSSSSSMSSLAL